MSHAIILNCVHVFSVNSPASLISCECTCVNLSYADIISQEEPPPPSWLIESPSSDSSPLSQIIEQSLTGIRHGRMQCMLENLSTIICSEQT